MFLQILFIWLVLRLRLLPSWYSVILLLEFVVFPFVFHLVCHRHSFVDHANLLFILPFPRSIHQYTLRVLSLYSSERLLTLDALHLLQLLGFDHLQVLLDELPSHKLFIVTAFDLKKGLVSTPLNLFAVRHDDDLVGVLDRAEAMGNNDNSLLL